MKKFIVFFGAITWLLFPRVDAGEPAAPYCFSHEATVRLAALDTTNSDGLVQRMILLHNLAFKGDADSRATAEGLNKRLRKQLGETPLLQAYRGSLEMLEVCHQSKASVLAGTVIGQVPFVDTPLDDLEDGFKQITKAVQRDTADLHLRILRATAATEVGEHLPKLLAIAYIDLLFLGRHLAAADSAIVFFYNLSWAKYYYKYALNLGKSYPGVADWQAHRLAGEYLALACSYAWTQTYQDEVTIWECKVAWQ